MKRLMMLLTIVTLSAGIAAAQDLSGNANRPAASPYSNSTDVTGFHSPATLGPVQSSKMPNVHPTLKPQLGGIFVDGGKYGAQLINPQAPASYGIGEKYLTAPDPRYDVFERSGPDAHRQAGGFNLFSLEF